MLGTGKKCSRATGICGICHVRHTSTIQAKRDAATCTLKREEIQKGVEMQHFARDVNVMRIVLLLLIMRMMSGCRTVSVGSITLCETVYKALQWAYDDSPNYV